MQGFRNPVGKYFPAGVCWNIALLLNHSMDLQLKKAAEKPEKINLKETSHSEMQAANDSPGEKIYIYIEQFPVESSVPSVGKVPGFRALRFIPLLPLVGVWFNYKNQKECNLIHRHLL